MGIYDREYYRRDGPSFLGSFADRGMICKWLIGINIVLFLFQLIGGPRSPVTQWLVLDVASVRDHWQVWRLLTYAFLHDPDSIWHIIFNLLFLWWFGNELESIYGSWEFLAFYLISAVLGGLAFLVQYFNARGICLGASGAVTAVMVLYALHFPRRVILLFFFLPVPIWLLVVFQVAVDMLGFMGGARDGVAFVVHLAGAAFGLVYFKLHWRVLNWLPDLSAWRLGRNRPSLRVYQPEAEETPVPVAAAPAAPEVDEQLEAKLDAVLEKVARFGQASLTDTERAILLRASEVYNRRRS